MKHIFIILLFALSFSLAGKNSTYKIKTGICTEVKSKKSKLPKSHITKVLVTARNKKNKTATVKVSFTESEGAKFYAVLATSGKNANDEACLNSSAKGLTTACISTGKNVQDVIFPGLKANTEFSFLVKPYDCALNDKKNPGWGSRDLKDMTREQKRSNYLFKHRTDAVDAVYKNKLQFSSIGQFGILKGSIMATGVLTKKLRIAETSKTNTYLELKREDITKLSLRNVLKYTEGKTGHANIGALKETTITNLIKDYDSKPYLIFMEDATGRRDFEIYFDMEKVAGKSKKKVHISIQEPGADEEALYGSAANDANLDDFLESMVNLWYTKKGNWPTPFKVPAGEEEKYLGSHFTPTENQKSFAKLAIFILTHNSGMGIDKYALVHKKLLDYWEKETSTTSSARLQALLKALKEINPFESSSEDLSFVKKWSAGNEIPVYGAQRIDLSFANGLTEETGTSLDPDLKLLLRSGCKTIPTAGAPCPIGFYYKKDDGSDTKIWTPLDKTILIDASDADDQILLGELIADGLWVYSDVAGTEGILDIRKAPSYFVNHQNSFPQNYVNSDLTLESDFSKLSLKKLGAIEVITNQDVLTASYVQVLDQETNSATITKQVRNFLQTGREATIALKNPVENASFTWSLKSLCTGANCDENFDCNDYITPHPTVDNKYSMKIKGLITPPEHVCELSVFESITDEDGSSKDVRFGTYKFVTGEIISEPSKKMVLGCFGLNADGKECSPIPLGIGPTGEKIKKVKITIDNYNAELLFSKDNKYVPLFDVSKPHNGKNGSGLVRFVFDKNGNSSIRDLNDSEFSQEVKDLNPTWADVNSTLSIRGQQAGMAEVEINMYTGAGRFYVNPDATNEIVLTAVKLQIRPDLNQNDKYGDATDLEMVRKNLGLGLIVPAPTKNKKGESIPGERVKIEIANEPAELNVGTVKLSLKQTGLKKEARVNIYESEDGETPIVFDANGEHEIALDGTTALKDIFSELWIEGTAKSTQKQDLELKIQYFMADKDVAVNSDLLTITVMSCDPISATEDDPLKLGPLKFHFKEISSSGRTNDGYCQYSDINAALALEIKAENFFEKEFVIPFAVDQTEKTNKLTFNTNPFTSEFSGVSYFYNPKSPHEILSSDYLSMQVVRANLNLNKNKNDVLSLTGKLDLTFEGPSNDKTLLKVGKKHEVILKSGLKADLKLDFAAGSDLSVTVSEYNFEGLGLEYKHDNVIIGSFKQSDKPVTDQSREIEGAFQLKTTDSDNPAITVGGVTAELSKFKLAAKANVLDIKKTFKLLPSVTVDGQKVESEAEIKLSGIKGLDDASGNPGTIILNAKYEPGATESSSNFYELSLAAGQESSLNFFGFQVSDFYFKSKLTDDFDFSTLEGTLDARYTEFKDKSGSDFEFQNVQFILEGPTKSSESTRLTRFYIQQAAVMYKGVGLELKELNYKKGTESIKDKVSFGEVTAKVRDAVTLKVDHLTIDEDGDYTIGGLAGELKKSPIDIEFNASFETGGIKGSASGKFALGKAGIAFSGNFAAGHSKKSTCENSTISESAQNYFNYAYADLEINASKGIPLGPSGLELSGFSGRLGVNYYIPIDKIFEGGTFAGTACRDAYIVGLGLQIGDVLGIFSIKGNAAVVMTAEHTSMGLEGTIDLPKNDPSDTDGNNQILNSKVVATYTFGSGIIKGSFKSHFYLPKKSWPMISLEVNKIEYKLDFSDDSDGGQSEWSIKGVAPTDADGKSTSGHFFVGKLLDDDDLKVYGEVFDFKGTFDSFIPEGQIKGGVNASKSISFRYPANFMNGITPSSNMDDAALSEKYCDVADATDNSWGFGFVGSAAFSFQSELNAKIDKDGFESKLSVTSGVMDITKSPWELTGSGVFGSVIYKLPCAITCETWWSSCVNSDKIGFTYGGSVKLGNRCMEAEGEFTFVDEDYKPKDDDNDNDRVDLHIKFPTGCSTGID